MHLNSHLQVLTILKLQTSLQTIAHCHYPFKKDIPITLLISTKVLVNK